MTKTNRAGTAIALTALFIALAGGAYAASKIGSKDLKRGAVTAKKIKNRAVGTGKIRDGAVTGAKLADDSVGPASIKNRSVTEGKIADDAVTGETLARVFERTAQQGVDNNDVVSVRAGCNEGETLISGGGGWEGSGFNVILRSSEPDGNGWAVSGQNASGGIKQLKATALCLGDSPD